MGPIQWKGVLCFPILAISSLTGSLQLLVPVVVVWDIIFHFWIEWTTQLLDWNCLGADSGKSCGDDLHRYISLATPPLPCQMSHFKDVIKTLLSICCQYATNPKVVWFPPLPARSAAIVGMIWIGLMTKLSVISVIRPRLWGMGPNSNFGGSTADSPVAWEEQAGGWLAWKIEWIHFIKLWTFSEDFGIVCYVWKRFMVQVIVKKRKEKIPTKIRHTVEQFTSKPRGQCSEKSRVVFQSLGLTGHIWSSFRSFNINISKV